MHVYSNQAESCKHFRTVHRLFSIVLERERVMKLLGISAVLVLILCTAAYQVLGTSESDVDLLERNLEDNDKEAQDQNGDRFVPLEPEQNNYDNKAPSDHVRATEIGDTTDQTTENHQTNNNFDNDDKPAATDDKDNHDDNTPNDFINKDYYVSDEQAYNQEVEAEKNGDDFIKASEPVLDSVAPSLSDEYDETEQALADDAVINEEVDTQSICYIRNCSWVNKTIHQRLPFSIHYCHNVRYSTREYGQVRYACGRIPHSRPRKVCQWVKRRRCSYRGYPCRTYYRRLCRYRSRTTYTTRYCYRRQFKTVFRYKCVRRTKIIYRYRYISTRRYICRYTVSSRE